MMMLFHVFVSLILIPSYNRFILFVVVKADKLVL